MVHQRFLVILILLVQFIHVILCSENESDHGHIKSGENESKSLIPDDVIVDEKKFLLMHLRGPCNPSQEESDESSVENFRKSVLKVPSELQAGSIESLTTKAFLISKFGLDLVQQVETSDFRKKTAPKKSTDSGDSSYRSNTLSHGTVVHEVSDLKASMALRRSMTLDSLSVLLALQQQSSSPADRRSKAVKFVSEIAGIASGKRDLSGDKENATKEDSNDSSEDSESTESPTDDELQHMVGLLEKIMDNSKITPPLQAEVFPEESILSVPPPAYDFVSSKVPEPTSELESLIHKTKIRSSKLLKRLYVDVVDLTPTRHDLYSATTAELQEVAKFLTCVEDNFTPELLFPIHELIPSKDMLLPPPQSSAAAATNNTAAADETPAARARLQAALAMNGGTVQHSGNSTDSTPASTVDPNDEYFYAQWAMFATNVQAGWSRFSGSTTPFPVAVVDTGCAFHPDLAANLWVDPDIPACAGSEPDYPNFSSGCYGYDYGDGDGLPCDEPLTVVHGTAVSGVVAASSNNAVGVTGVCWGCQVVCLKIVRDDVIPLSTVLEAYDYILAKGIRLSNHSYAGWGFIPLQYSAMQIMQEEGHLFVAASGNNGCDVDDPADTRCGGSSPIRPAGYNLDNILSVGSSDIAGRISRFSNYGKQSVDIYAPGDEVFLLWNSLADTPLTGYNTASGTSFASPFAAGVAALVWGANPSWDYKRVISRMKNTVTQTAEMKDRSTSGGVINVGAALQLSELTEEPMPRSNSDLPDLTGLFYNVTSTSYSTAVSRTLLKSLICAHLILWTLA